jgi:hypothetical protein
LKRKKKNIPLSGYPKPDIKRGVMRGFIIKIFILAGIFGVLIQPVFAKSRVLTEVKVIHASTGPVHVDPGLKPFASELESVFKYTSYRLLNDQHMGLEFNQEGRVNLPGERILIVVPSDMEGKRIGYQIRILEKKHSIFQTRVLLKNNDSITIGGPRYQNGTLLFNISGSLR